MNNVTKLRIELALVTKFREMLKKETLTWYSLLSKNSISSFAELADSFVKAHIGAKKVEKKIKDLSKILHGSTKLPKEYLHLL